MSHYSIHVLEYAFVKEFPLSGLVYGAHNQGTCKLPYGYVLIRGGGRNILVDCGHDYTAYGKTLSERFGVENWRSPADVLAEIDITPADITDVIITHAHFDHMGGIRFFPNATFYIQERELSQWIQIMSLPRKFRWLMVATDPADILRCVSLAEQGRLVSLSGDHEDLFPGIDVMLAEESHTPGSQYVVVRNDGERDSADSYVLAGDLVYRDENLTGGDEDDPYYVPIGLASGSQTNILMAMDRMVKTVGGEQKRVVAAHEERLPTYFPSTVTKAGLTIIEIALATGENSAVS